jgi:ATP-dependent DNA ligase
MQPIPYFGEQIRGEWIYEPKIDGWRMQILKYNNGVTECWGRRLERKPNWSSKLGYLLEELHENIPKGTVFDCELYSTGGRRYIPSLFAKKPKVKPLVYVFDVVYLKGVNVSKKTLKTRKRMLSGISIEPPFFCVKGKKLTNVKSDYSSEMKKGHEGIVIKKLDSPYLLGKEAPIATQWWRKIK